MAEKSAEWLNMANSAKALPIHPNEKRRGGTPDGGQVANQAFWENRLDCRFAGGR